MTVHTRGGGLSALLTNFPHQPIRNIQFPRRPALITEMAHHFLNQYLPFWISNYVKRAIAVLVTAVAILLPTFNYAAAAAQNGWSSTACGLCTADLRLVEASLQKGTDAAGMTELEKELENLDREIGSFGVPMKHSDLYFATISHLNLVRRRRMRLTRYEPGGQSS